MVTKRITKDYVLYLIRTLKYEIKCLLNSKSSYIKEDNQIRLRDSYQRLLDKEDYIINHVKEDQQLLLRMYARLFTNLFIDIDPLREDITEKDVVKSITRFRI